MASPAKPGTGHRDGCTCVACRRWREATLEAARLRTHNLNKARMAAAGAAVARKEIKREEAHGAIEKDVQHTDRKLRELRETFAKKDPRTEVFLALRAKGKSFAEATAEVERQFGNDHEQINEGEIDVQDDGPG